MRSDPRILDLSLNSGVERLGQSERTIALGKGKRRDIDSAPGLFFAEKPGVIRARGGKIVGDAADDWLRRNDPKYHSRSRRY